MSQQFASSNRAVSQHDSSMKTAHGFHENWHKSTAMSDHSMSDHLDLF